MARELSMPKTARFRIRCPYPFTSSYGRVRRIFLRAVVFQILFIVSSGCRSAVVAPRSGSWTYRLSTDADTMLLRDSITGVRVVGKAVCAVGGMPSDGGGVQGGVACLLPEDGKLKWIMPLGLPDLSTPVAARGRLYIIDYHSTLFALEADSGVPVWYQRTGLEAAHQFEPLVGASRVYVTGESNHGRRSPINQTIVAYSVRDGREMWRFTQAGWAKYVLDESAGALFLAHSDGRLITLDAGSGRTRQTSKVGEGPFDLVASSHALVWIEPNHIRCLSIPALNHRWRRDLSISERPASPTTGLPVGIRDNTLYCASLPERRIYALDLTNGRTKWSSRTMGDVEPSLFLVRDDCVVYGVTNEHGADLYWLRRADGRPLTQVSVGGQIRVGYHVMDGSDSGIYVGTSTSIQALPHPTQLGK
jgi:outer membrane protein assembly factor BamB